MPTNPDSDLMRIFDFTAADLEANHAGKLSERQTERLSNRKNQGQWLAGIGCIVAAVFIFLALGSGLSTSMKNGGTSIIILLGVMALPIIYISLGMMDRDADLTRNKPKVYSGQVWTSKQYGKFGPTYWIWTSEINIKINPTVYIQLNNNLNTRGENGIFRLYYAPNSIELLSIEGVERTNPISTNPDPDLMQIFDFTAADLEANHAGKMSDGQKQQLLHIAQSQKDDAGCLTWLMMPGYIFLGCIALQAFGSGNKTYALIFAGVIGALLFGQAVMLYDSHYRNHPETDVLVSEFAHVQGLLQPIIKKSWYRARQIENEYLRIGQMDIPIKKSVYKALQQYLATQSEVPICRIYYAPKSLQIIAAEIIDS